jgi:hypothetical protein
MAVMFNSKLSCLSRESPHFPILDPFFAAQRKTAVTVAGVVEGFGIMPKKFCAASWFTKKTFSAAPLSFWLSIYHHDGIC